MYLSLHLISLESFNNVAYSRGMDISLNFHPIMMCVEGIARMRESEEECEGGRKGGGGEAGRQSKCAKCFI